MPMINRPIQVTRNTAAMVMICAISQRSSVSLIRSMITVARARCRAGARYSSPFR